MADLNTHINTIKSVFGFTLNESQLRAVSDWLDGKHLFLSGVAGSGKTWIAMYLAMLSIMNKEQSDLRIVRSLVPTRDIGFLPGEVDDKARPYMEIYEPIVYEVLTAFAGKNTNKDFMKSHIHFENTSFLRGKTWDNCVIYLDEVQNLNIHELHTVMTRVGKNSRVIISGDYFQSDLRRAQSSHEFLEDAVSRMDMFSQVNFYSEDIVRSEFVREWCEVAEPMMNQ